MVELAQGRIVPRRALLRRTAAGLALAAPVASVPAGVSPCDLAGQRITMSAPARRIVLGDGRLIYPLALLGGFPLMARVIGWQNDFRLMAPASYAAFTDAMPSLRAISAVGQTSEQSVSVEQILSLRPDLAIFGLIGHGPLPGGAVHQQLRAAGIPVVFVDFSLRPLVNTPTSIRLLGRILGFPQRGETYAAWFETNLARLRAQVAALAVPNSRRPRVFMELLPLVWPSAGHTCGHGSMGDLIEAAGGQNIAAGLLPGPFGELSMEYVLWTQPDLYIATGNRPPGIVLGPGASAEGAAAGMQRVLKRPGLSSLRAVAAGQTCALWHEFHDSPFGVVALEVIASWLWSWASQRAVAGLDPGARWAELHERFMPLAEPGTYWLSGPSTPV